MNDPDALAASTARSVDPQPVPAAAEPMDAEPLPFASTASIQALLDRWEAFERFLIEELAQALQSVHQAEVGSPMDALTGRLDRLSEATRALLDMLEHCQAAMGEQSPVVAERLTEWSTRLGSLVTATASIAEMARRKAQGRDVEEARLLWAQLAAVR